MTDKHLGHRQAWKRIPARIRERERRDREPVLIAIVCPDCLRELAEVLPDTEAYCPDCRRWTSAYDATNEKDVIA